MKALESTLYKLERFGNRLPHPTLLFVWLAFFLIILSAVAVIFKLSAIHPLSQEAIVARSLLSGEGVRQIVSHLVTNFTQFAPVGPVLVAMLGLGIAERSGLLDILLKALLNVTRERGLSLIVVLLGVFSSIAADAGYVVLIPLAGALFQTAGKPPLAGIAASFMGVSGGYSANLLLGPVDVILSGISTEAAQIYQPDYQVAITANYYFMVASTGFIALIGAWVTEKVTIPYLTAHGAAYSKTQDNQAYAPNAIQLQLTELQKRGLQKTACVVLLVIVIIALLVLPENAPLRNQQEGTLLNSPFITHIVVFIAVIFAVAGVVYGRATHSLTTQTNVIEAMEESMRSMAGYLVLMFFAAQMVAIFSWSQLGLIFSIKGAQWLAGLVVPKEGLLVGMLFLVAVINLLIGSASAKWALLAPIFVPMLMIVGIPPEWTQVTYRIGDSASNIITPLMPYFALVVAYMQKYEPDRGLGSLMAVMMPYSVLLLIGWGLLLVLWSILGLPLGPSL